MSRSGNGGVSAGIVNGVSNGGEIPAEHGLRRRVRIGRQRLDLPQSFVVAIEPQLVFVDRPAQRAAELVALQVVFGGGKEVARIENIIAHELECLAVERVAAALGGDVHQRGIRPLVRHEEALLHLELIDVRDGQIDRRFAQTAAARSHAVDQVAGGLRHVAAQNDAAVRMAHLRSDDVGVAARWVGGAAERTCSPRDQRKLQKIAAVQRQALHAS